MELFGQIVRTVVNVALLPVAVASDVLTLGGAATGTESATVRAIRTIKEESAPKEPQR